MKHRFMQVDVFTARAFAGNPVAVVFDADDLPTERMQAIARWTNLSETTFVCRPTQPDADYRLRIFTPAEELPFAGHPTLGSCAAWRTNGGQPRGARIVQECGVGLVPLAIEADGRLALRVPDAKFTAVDASVRAEVEAALGAAALDLPAVVDVGPRWLTLEVASGDVLRTLAPDMAALAALGRAQRITGVNVFGRDAESIEVRSFAPHLGVAEDPVCGSGNGAVAHFRARHAATADYHARQGRCMRRDGHVRVAYRADGVWLGGDTVICVDGTLDA